MEKKFVAHGLDLDQTMPNVELVHFQVPTLIFLSYRKNTHSHTPTHTHQRTHTHSQHTTHTQMKNSKKFSIVVFFQKCNAHTLFPIVPYSCFFQKCNYNKCNISTFFVKEILIALIDYMHNCLFLVQCVQKRLQNKSVPFVENLIYWLKSINKIEIYYAWHQNGFYKYIFSSNSIVLKSFLILNIT